MEIGNSWGRAMAGRRSASVDAKWIRRGLALLLMLPRQVRIVVVVMGVVVAGAGYVRWLWRGDGGIAAGEGPGHGLVTPGSGQSEGSAPEEYLVCFWNVENLFDDVDDPRPSIDEEYDNGFARDARLRQLKYERLCEALLRLNGGRGPDMIACVEVEGSRAAELLRMELNRRIAEEGLRYGYVAVRDLPNAGRHIAPAVISRLPIKPMATRLVGSRLRILETEISVGGHDLRVIVSHWTSQLRQQDGGRGETGRMSYARTIRSAVDEILKREPMKDVLVCGDFNDTPDSGVVREGLKATGNRGELGVSPGSWQLLAVFAGKPADRYGTIWYSGQPRIYDQFCVTAGMLDRVGWWCDPERVRTETAGLIRRGASRREPWRFGKPMAGVGESERGYSDHFPITMPLGVEGGRVNP